MASPYADQYLQACDHAFDVYSNNIQLMQKFISEKEPIDRFLFFDSNQKKETLYGNLKSDKDIESAKRIYKSVIKAKSLDVLRGLLPASTLTNLGITGNGRAFEYLLSTMYASSLKETKKLADQVYAELNLIIPAFVGRANDKYGKTLQSYFENTKTAISKVAQSHIKNIKAQENVQYAKLLYFEDNFEAEVKVVSAILYEHAQGQSLGAIIQYTRSITPEERYKIIRAYTKFRSNRRHRPGRAFEMVEYTFELFTNFGMFRDMHRHRILTLERQLLSTRHGYDIPAEVIGLGIVKDYRDCMYKSKEVYENISKNMPEEAQYVVNFAYRYPYFIKLNLREAYHLIELRTVPQGHTDYRNICQKMFEQIKRIHPVLVDGMKFVDLKKYKLERLNAEKNSEKKRMELN
jgi:thymidylate synthase ThyX